MQPSAQLFIEAGNQRSVVCPRVRQCVDIAPEAKIQKGVGRAAIVVDGLLALAFHISPGWPAGLLAALL